MSSPFYRTRTSASVLKMSKVVYEGSSWDCQYFYIRKTKTNTARPGKLVILNYQKSAIADRVISTGY